MFAELLQKPSQKYLIEAIDAQFDSINEEKKKLIDSQTLSQFNDSDLIEESLEQLNVKFCESLIDQEDSNISTEINSDENESLVGERKKIVSINDFMAFTSESLGKFKEKYSLNVQYQIKLYNQYAQMILAELMNQKINTCQQSLKQSKGEKDKDEYSNKSIFDNKFDCSIVDSINQRQ